MINNLAFRKFSDNLFIFGCFTLSASIPVSKFTTSVSLFLMALAWLLQWNWKEKKQQLLSNKKLFIIVTLAYYTFVFGMFYSSDIGYGLKDLKIKIPLFALPVLFVTGVQLNKKQVLIALSLMSASAVTASIIGFINYKLKIGTPEEITNLRELSPFISHIRLTLLLCFGVGLSVWGVTQLKSKLKFLLILPVLWIVYFIVFIGNLTGVIILPLVIFLFIVSYIYRYSKKFAIIGILISVLCIIFSVVQVLEIYQLVFVSKPVLENKHETKRGNKYTHDLSRKDTENGSLTWSYVCEKELEEAWDLKSQTKYKSRLNGFPFKDVLIRYLTSKGVHKDYEGVNNLSEKDIKAIEKGIANVYYIEHNKLLSRLHTTFWELKNLENSGYVNGSSITMRFEYWKTGWQIFRDVPLLGVGTGDIQNEYQKAYKLNKSSLDLKYQRRSHNQYLSILISLGAFGLILFLFSVIYPLLKYKGELEFLYLVSVVIFLTSMLWEDTIESQAGATSFALLISLFIFSKKTSE
tara:strand:+ start:2192 stop:3754 length:1563 start_codon:yes stop_codon:yes gene_type:complete